MQQIIENILDNIMDNIELCSSVIGTILGLIIAIIICIVRLVKTIKSKNQLQDETDLLNAVAPIMEIAEKFTNYSGTEKKEYVLTRINQLAIENGIEYDEQVISDKIEELIKLTKEVNYNKENEAV